MVDRYFGGIIPAPELQVADASMLFHAAERLPATIENRIENFAFHDALSAIWDFVALANKYVADSEPWSLAKQAISAPDSNSSERAHVQLQHCLLELANALWVIAKCLGPFLPATSDKLLKQIGMDPVSVRRHDDTGPGGNEICKDEILFPSIEF